MVIIYKDPNPKIITNNFAIIDINGMANTICMINIQKTPSMGLNFGLISLPI